MGGAIGTGLFLGSAQVIQSAGPSIILGYAIGGLIAFLIMRQLGEMIVEEPVAGSFSHFANKYWGKFLAFLAGWNYWILYVLVAMTELTAVAKYINYWWPHIPSWVSVLFFFVVITAINLTNVKFYGESEFWLAIIKVVAVISMIILVCICYLQQVQIQLHHLVIYGHMVDFFQMGLMAYFICWHFSCSPLAALN
jgi:AAT family amino acid transporter/aromatic amino acid transport protein AroP